MSLLSVVQDVCAVVGVEIPTSVFSNIPAKRTAVEMLALANEMAQRIAYDSREWTKLKLVNTFTGDGVTEAFDLPNNYKRMLMTANVWRSGLPLMPVRFIPDTDEWINRRMRNFIDPRGEWTMYGGQMHIVPALIPGETATFVYLDKNAITLASGGTSDNFMADGDKFRLGSRLLKLGMIWQWKANKGSPYAEDLSTYDDAIMIEMGSDKPSPIIIGRQTISGIAANVAFPYPIPTP
jgi:hypothetical protein